MIDRDRHLFIIDDAAYRACSEDEVQATAKAMQEFGIFKLPYERVAVRMPLDTAGVMRSDLKLSESMSVVKRPDGRYQTLFGPHHWIELRNVNQLGEPVELWFIHEGGDPKFRRYEMNETFRYDKDNALLRENIARFLIVLLGTRNAVKTTERNKLAALGIGKKMRRYTHITTIQVPRGEELGTDTEHAPSGRTMRPHLRRGHPRQQAYGPGRALRKPVWIEPMFINADAEWVAGREAYRLSGPK